MKQFVITSFYLYTPAVFVAQWTFTFKYFTQQVTNGPPGVDRHPPIQNVW